MAEDLKLYAVRNKEGQWFRRKGYGGYGKTWVDDFALARIYNRIGQARSIVTFFAKGYPEYGVPDLVCLHVDRVEVLDETVRVGKAIERIQTEEERRELRNRQYRLELAQRDLEEAKKRVAAAKKGKRKK